jgi:tetratricopeptide (TPR) repeat protein
VGILLSKIMGADKKPIERSSLRVFTAVSLVFLSFYLGFYGLAEAAYQHQKIGLATRLAPFRSDLWYAKALNELSSPYSLDSAPHREEILRDIKKSLSLNDKDPFVWSRLAKVLSVISPDSKDEILHAFDRSIELAPAHAPFWVDYALYNLAVGEFSKAEAFFTSAINLEPLAPIPQYGLGVLYLKEKKKEGAFQCFSKALRLKQSYDFKDPPSEYHRYLFDVDENAILGILAKLSSPTNKITHP